MDQMESKWLSLAIAYSQLSGKFWDKGDYNRYRLAIEQSNDCFDKHEALCKMRKPKLRVVC